MRWPESTASLATFSSRRQRLPAPRPGDVLAVAATGAYSASMASNYNGLPRPAAVVVRDGAARLVVRRETVADLLGAQVG